MTPDPIDALARRAQSLADQEARAERTVLVRLLTEPTIALVVKRLGVTDLATAAAEGRIAAGPMVRMLTAAADVATQAHSMARRDP